jgi:alpha-amylase
MKKICFYFQVHQPFRLRPYHFFDIDNNHNYFDEGKNKAIMQKVAAKSYLPANEVLLDLITKHHGKFKVSFSISGTAIDQFELYAPKVLKSFQNLADTGCVEFLAETDTHSLSSLIDQEEFKRQVKVHSKKIKLLFNQVSEIFRNTELIYSNDIGAIVSEMGYKAMLAEGADHILGYKSPNFMYSTTSGMPLLLKNHRLSDDIAFRFSQKDWAGWPLTADKFADWVDSVPESENLINLFMDYETFGEHQWAETGIFDFLKALPQHIFSAGHGFTTPSEAIKEFDPVETISMPQPVSWADTERNLSAWLGNNLQDDAFESLYTVGKKIKEITDPGLIRDWGYLQTSDHFYYMCTKYFSDGDVHKYFNHYNSPYEAFINYMNVLTDFEKRINNHVNNNYAEMRKPELRSLIK